MCCERTLMPNRKLRFVLSFWFWCGSSAWSERSLLELRRIQCRRQRRGCTSLIYIKTNTQNHRKTRYSREGRPQPTRKPCHTDRFSPALLRGGIFIVGLLELARSLQYFMVKRRRGIEER